MGVGFNHRNHEAIVHNAPEKPKFLVPQKPKGREMLRMNFQKILEAGYKGDRVTRIERLPRILQEHAHVGLARVIRNAACKHFARSQKRRTPKRPLRLEDLTIGA